MDGILNCDVVKAISESIKKCVDRFTRSSFYYGCVCDCNKCKVKIDRIYQMVFHSDHTWNTKTQCYNNFITYLLMHKFPTAQKITWRCVE
jgi:hypothetical protein